MLNIKNGKCTISGSLEEITDDFRYFFKAITYTADYALLDILLQVIGEGFEDAENNPSN